MRLNKSLRSKMILKLGIPSAILFVVMLGVVLYCVKQSVIDVAQLIVVQRSIIIIFGTGLIFWVGLLFLTISILSNRVDKMAKTLQLIDNDELNLAELEKTDGSKDSLDEMLGHIHSIAMKYNDNILLANAILEGDFSQDDSVATGSNRLGHRLNQISSSLKEMGSATQNYLERTRQGIFEKSSTTEALTGDLTRVMHHVDEIINTIIDKMDFYSSILDAIPHSFLVTDADMKFKYFNKRYSDYLVSFGIIENRQSAMALDCCISAADMCGTERCARRLLVEKGLSTTNFAARGKYYKMDMVYLKDKNGEATTDLLEMTMDQTSIMSVNEFTKTEVARFEKNLICLAEGDLNFDLAIGDVNDYTDEVYRQFNSIAQSMERVKGSISALTNNASRLINATVKGELDTRADVSQFSGNWKTLIDGMNKILEETSKPINEVVQVMDSISKGHLDARIKGIYQGDFEKLKQSVNQTTKNLNLVIGEIASLTGEISSGNLNINRIENFGGDYNSISNSINTIVKTLNGLLLEINDSAQQVSAGANQVAVGSQSLAQGSTEQASSIEELTASITEIANQTKKSAGDASSAQNLAIRVKENALNGNTRMIEMQDSMLEINRSSVDISKIIKVIDDIAFQTNILALNAAVEAARAGQHGKGFAVVAEEVRTLAARSAEAAKETTLLIEGSIGKVQTGTKIADETATALSEIVDGIGQVTDLIGRIARASNEQATGIAQINIGIEQVTTVVHQNSATAEESAAASEELSGQAELLKDKLRYFTLR